MKKMIIALLMAASLPALAVEINTQATITVGAPNFYGRIDIGNMAPPRVINAEPILVVRPAPTVVVAPAPVYLRVPPGHQKHWDKHCHEYNACNVKVFFVHEDWYNATYARNDGDEHGHGKEHGKGHGKGHGKDKD